MENKNLFTNTFMKVTRIEDGIGCDAWYTCVALLVKNHHWKSEDVEAKIWDWNNTTIYEKICSFVSIFGLEGEEDITMIGNIINWLDKALANKEITLDDFNEENFLKPRQVCCKKIYGKAINY